MRRRRINIRFYLIAFMFIVTVVTLSQEKNVMADEKVNHGDEIELEIDKKTGIATPESVLKRYLNKVDFLNESESFEQYCHIFWDNVIFEDIFLNAGNTSEEWDNMTHLERYNYDKLVTEPERNSYVKDEEKFISNLKDDAMEFLDYVENGEVVGDALEEVWRWQYQYKMIYGTTYNFYTMENQSTNTEIAEESIIDEGELSKKDVSELNELNKEIDNENMHGKTNDSVMISLLKKYTLTFVVVLFGCIVGILVYFKKKDKL